ncbi:MAG: hypothetical protein ACE369_12590 [Roseovarius sp.]
MRHSKIIDACLVGLAGAFLLATLPVTLMMAGPAQPGRPALVVAPPWGGGAARIIAQAGGTPVGPVAAPMARFAVFDHPSRATEAGAWAVLDAAALASLCGIGGIRT